MMLWKIRSLKTNMMISSYVTWCLYVSLYILYFSNSFYGFFLFYHHFSFHFFPFTYTLSASWFLLLLCTNFQLSLIVLRIFSQRNSLFSPEICKQWNKVWMWIEWNAIFQIGITWPYWIHVCSFYSWSNLPNTEPTRGKKTTITCVLLH